MDGKPIGLVRYMCAAPPPPPLPPPTTTIGLVGKPSGLVGYMYLPPHQAYQYTSRQVLNQHQSV